MDNPDVIEQVPTGGGVNKPESGTYGEGAALQRLQSQLPVLAGPGGQEQPALPAMGGGPQPPSAPAGLPPALLGPTARPSVPTSTPLAVPTAPATPAQARLELLQAIAQSPEVGEETREWAQLVLNRVMRVVE